MEPLKDVEALCAQFGFKKSTAYKLMRLGLIDYIQVYGHLRLVRESAIERFLERREVVAENRQRFAKRAKSSR